MPAPAVLVQRKPPQSHQSPRADPAKLPTVVVRRVAPVRQSAWQQVVRAWPALLLLLACCAGLLSSRWRASSPLPPPPVRVIPRTTPFNSMQPLSPQRSEETLTADELFTHEDEESDLSMFPPEAWNHTSLTTIPSALLPDSWYVQTDAGPLEVRRVFADPLLLTMPRFLSEAECLALIAAGNRTGYHRSLTSEGIADIRTSWSAHVAEADPAMVTFLKRIQAVVGEPVAHFEVGPVIRYNVSEKFGEHWDSMREKSPGRRLTFLVPLHSEPGEEGGHTAFPVLGFRFPPTQGTAIIWRNYMPKALDNEYDRRMKHEGEPPRRGFKYAINVWVHTGPYGEQCGG